MKNILGTISIIVLFLLTSGCAQSKIEESANVDNNIKEISKSKEKSVPRENRIDMRNKDGIPISSIQASMVDTFVSVEEIEKNSDLTIRGIITNNEYLEYDNMAFTISTIKIEEIITNEGEDSSIQVGGTIRLLQTGGIITQSYDPELEKDFTTDEQNKDFKENIEGTKIEVVLESAPVLKENTNSILFLQKYEGPIGQDLYVGTGDYQGRFIIESDSYIEPQSENVVSDDGNIDFTLQEIKEEVLSVEVESKQ